MPNGSNRTEKQHYVPRVYLKGFALQYLDKCSENSKSSKTKCCVFYYDLQERTQSKIVVPVNSVCFERDLCEVTGKKGEVVYDNRLENCFSILENRYAKLRTNIEKKAFVKDNYKTKCFLTRDEKLHLMGYMTIQILRTPTFLNLALKVAQEVWEKGKSEEQLKNIVRIQCLSFIDTYYKKDENDVCNNKKFVRISDNQFEILGSIIGPMVGMSFMIGVDNESRLITSDNPVYIRNSNKDCFMNSGDTQNDEIIFSITASLCLIMVGTIKANPQFSDIPFILLTGKDTLQAQEESMKCGADVFLRKPTSINVLQDTLQNQLMRSKKIQQKISHNYPQMAIYNRLTSEETELAQKIISIINKNISNPELDEFVHLILSFLFL